LRKQTPKRSYRAVIDALKQVWKIDGIPEGDAVWKLGTPDMESFDPKNIRVTVWNLCKGAGGVLFEHDYRSLCYRSDLILTQEALLSKKSIRVFCERGFETIHAASYKRRDGLRDGVMTVSRVAALGEVKRIVCKYPEPFFKTPKVALVKFFHLEGAQHPLMVINIHATLVRLKSAAVEEMQHLLSHLPAHEGPVLLAGDFNTFTPGYLKAVSSVLNKIGLKYVDIPNDPRPKTQALDQVFCRGLVVKNLRIDTDVKNSDHFPIVMTLSTV
jgi:endonuclease/exonuclease/phosphatase (EEP) superfamily protein YafD